ncbi:hypothetical protein ACSSV1_004519 [Labrenzia sp. MBR-25]
MPNPIDDNDDLAIALGRLAGRWGLVEFAVEMIFTFLSEMPERKATITFSFFKAVGTQKDIIEFMAEETEWLSDEMKSQIKTAVRKYSNMSGERNGYIHYPFGYDTEGDDEFEIYKAKRSRTGDELLQKKAVTPEMINTFVDRVRELQLEIFRIHRALFEERRKAPKERPPYPNLTAASLLLRNDLERIAKLKQPDQ